MSVRAKTEGNRISLNSGFHCKLNTGSCVGPEGGNTFWDPVPRRYCLDNTYTMLYQGPSTRLETKSETIFTVNVRDTSFSVAITGPENSCGLNIYRTEHPKLFIVPGKDLGLLERNNAIQTNADNLDMFLYINAKFIYVERYIRSQVQSLYFDVMLHRCKLEKEMLKNTLAIASTQPDEFAFRFMEGPGYMAVVAGEVIHIVQCMPVELKIQHSDKCFNRVPVQRGNQSLYLTPRTHIITTYATEIPCNTPLLQYYKLGTTWHKFMP